MKQGIVIKSTGSWYLVKDTDGQIHKSGIKGKFRLKAFKLTNPVAVGDRVEFEFDKTGDQDLAVITKILPRKNYVVRQSPRKKHFMHLLAANVDQALLIVTITKPMLKVGFIDRFFIMTEPHDIPVTIVFNKADIYKEKHIKTFELYKEIYEKIGYEVLLLEAFKPESIEMLRSKIIGKTTLFSGQSGVGKSTIINQLIQTNVRTAELSESSGKGQHTTTFAEMFDLNPTGQIIDTPGIKTLSFNNYEVMDVAHNFREFFKYSKDCKFSDCTHRNEPDCAVKEAIRNGDIHVTRFDNYLQILDEIEGQNYWERLKGM